MFRHSLLILFVASVVGLAGASRRDGGPHPDLISIPTSLSPGSSGPAYLELTSTSSTNTVVTLTSSNTSQLTVPATVTVPAGSLEGYFTVTATPTATTSAYVTGSCNGGEVESNTVDF